MNEKNIKTCLVGAEIKDYSIHYCHFDSRKKYNEEICIYTYAGYNKIN